MSDPLVLGWRLPGRTTADAISGGVIAPAGHEGFTPVLGVERQGLKAALKVTSWEGPGAVPPATGYLAADGSIVATFAEASDIAGSSAKAVLIAAGLLPSDATDQDYLDLLQQPANEAGATVLEQITAAGLLVTGPTGTIKAREDLALAAVDGAVAASVAASAAPGGDLALAVDAGEVAIAAAADLVLHPVTGSLALAEAETLAAVDAEGVAQLARLARFNGFRYFPTTAAALSNGVVGFTGLAAGSGGTNGSFDAAFSGGGGENAAARFVVTGGALVSVILLSPGQNYATAPAVALTASAGLTGAAVTAALGPNRTVGDVFMIPHPGGEGLAAYEVTAGPVATRRVDLDIVGPEVNYDFVDLDYDTGRATTDPDGWTLPGTYVFQDGVVGKVRREIIPGADFSALPGTVRIAYPALPTDLPATPVGVWIADEYVASPRPYVPNQMSALAAPKNIFQAARRQFGNTMYWGGCTVTTGQTDHEGGTEAARIVGTGNWDFHPATTPTWPAGTYTMAGRYKSNTGVNQDFRMGINGAGGTFATKTATTSWQRFTHTMTLTGGGGQAMFARTLDGVTGGDLLVDELEVFPGSVDLGPEPQTGHLVLGTSAFDSAITWSGGVFGPAMTGVVQLPTAFVGQAYTAIMMASRTATGRPKGMGMARIGGTGTFVAELDNGGSVGSTAGGAYPQEPFYSPYGDGWRMFAHKGDASGQEMWLDGVKYLTANAGASAFNFKDLVFGIDTNYSFPNDFSLAAWVLYDRKLSSDELLAARRALAYRLASVSGITVPTAPAIIVLFEGDSITIGNVTTAYPVLYKPNKLAHEYAANYAVSGSAMSHVISRNSKADSTITTAVAAGNEVIYSLYVGINGLSTWTGATNADKAANFLTALRAQHAGRRALGAKTIACTIGPIEGQATHNAVRALVNPVILAEVGVSWDAVADFGGDPIMGPDDSRTNPVTASKWADATHPSLDGQAIYETIWRAARLTL